MTSTKVGHYYLGLVWDQPPATAAGFAPRCTFRFDSPKTAARAVRQAVAAGGYHAAIEMLNGAGHRTWRSLAVGGDGAFRANVTDADRFFLVDYVSTGRRPPTRLADPQTPVRYGRGVDAASKPRAELAGLDRSAVESGEGMWTIIEVMSLAGI